MNTLSCIILNYIIFLFSLSTFHLQEVASNNLGESACVYLGAIDKYCQFHTVPITDLPKECSAYVFEALFVDSNFTVTTKFSKADEEYLQKLLKSGKCTYSFYTHGSQPNWARILMNDTKANAMKEMKALSDFFNTNSGMAGLIIQDLKYEDESIPLPGFTDNLKIYIQIMRDTFPTLKIGLQLSGKFIVDYYGNASRPEWLDLEALNSSLDFYVVAFVFFNACTDNYRIGGTVPLDGHAKYTLEKVNNYLKMIKIPKEKLHFLFGLSPKLPPSPLGYNFCTSYEQICTGAKESAQLCADTEETFRAKGRFAKLNGAGFLGGFIDLDDYDMCCNCDHTFPAFHYILSGWNNAPPGKFCPLFNRNSS